MADRNEWIFTVAGMTCEHCAASIDEAVGGLPGVVETRTEYEEGRTWVLAGPDLSEDRIVAAIEGRGYRVMDRTALKGRRAHGQGAAGNLDLLIVGSGSAGFAAAIRARELGARVAMVERGDLGGTCVNIGCVPSKALIRAAEARFRASHHGFEGIHTEAGATDFGAVVAHKRRLVADLQKAKYWDVLAAYPEIELFRGSARVLPNGAVDVDGRTINARNVLLATGASPAMPPIPGLEEAEVLTSTELMDLDELPARLLVIGGGAVGLELGQAFARFGSRVTILEALSRIVPSEDETISEALVDSLRSEGLEIAIDTKVVQVSGKTGALRVTVSGPGGVEILEADQVLVATGRRPNTEGMGLQEAGVLLGPRGEVLVDEHLMTSRGGIYAAGDVIGDPAFVYVAAYAGNLAAGNALSDSPGRYDLSLVPRVTFTDPAVASVGLTEAQARDRGFDVALSVLPMAYVPRAIAARDTRGVVKLVAENGTNRLLGAHILAPEAGDIIQEAAMAIRFGVRVDQIAGMLHPYLTNAEAIKLACQTFRKDVSKLSCCAA